MKIPGPWKRTVTYLSKRFDPVTTGWPICIRTIVVTALLEKEADKLTLGYKLFLTYPHLYLVRPYWRGHQRDGCLSPGWFNIKPCFYINTAFISRRHKPSTLPGSCQTLTPKEPFHDCLEVTELIQSIRPNLTAIPLVTPDEILFTDVSDFIQDGTRHAGTVVVTKDRAIWAQSLIRKMSASWVEL